MFAGCFQVVSRSDESGDQLSCCLDTGVEVSLGCCSVVLRVWRGEMDHWNDGRELEEEMSSGVVKRGLGAAVVESSVMVLLVSCLCGGKGLGTGE